MTNCLKDEIEKKLQELKQDLFVREYIHPTLKVPRCFKGNGEIKLIIVGQDPTVKNATSNEKINCALNMDLKGSPLYQFVEKICADLGLNLKENIYATNLMKNFLTQRPNTITQKGFVQYVAGKWLPILEKELEFFPNVPVLTLGEPVLSFLVTERSKKLRDYWGYERGRNVAVIRNFTYSQMQQNKTNRCLFPFPHITTSKGLFYRQTLPLYTDYCKGILREW